MTAAAAVTRFLASQPARPAFGNCATCDAWRRIGPYPVCTLYPVHRIVTASHGCFQHIPKEKPE